MKNIIITLFILATSQYALSAEIKDAQTFTSQDGSYTWDLERGNYLNFRNSCRFYSYQNPFTDNPLCEWIVSIGQGYAFSKVTISTEGLDGPIVSTAPNEDRKLNLEIMISAAKSGNPIYARIYPASNKPHLHLAPYTMKINVSMNDINLASKQQKEEHIHQERMKYYIPASILIAVSLAFIFGLISIYRAYKPKLIKLKDSLAGTTAGKTGNQYTRNTISINNLTELAKLRSEGLLTESEYEEAKRKILDSI